MQRKDYIIFSVIIIVLSIASGLGGFFYGQFITKKQAELDKEAAVKGAIYDAKDQLTKEALEKAEEKISTTEDKNSNDAKKVLEDYYGKISKSEYEEAYELLSSDYKKTVYSANGLKKDFSNYTEIKVGNIEYRTSGETSALFAIEIEKVSKNATEPKKDTYFVQLTKNVEGTWEVNSIELKDKKQNFNSAWGSNS